MYSKYKIARDKAWEVLIECKICQLSVNLADIINHYGIYLVEYSNSVYIDKHNFQTEDGYSKLIDSNYVIYYNDSKSSNRIRFTIAHEIGHCVLGHVKENEETFRLNSETDIFNDINEMQANVFARDLLMPATVLHSLNINSAEEIAKLCNVSMQSAEIRFKRLQELNKRNMFNKHPP